MIITKLKQIYDGWKNYVFPNPEIEALAKSRAIICASCNFMVLGVCTKCGCPKLGKLRSPDSRCPIDLWKEMDLTSVKEPYNGDADVPMNHFKNSDEYIKYLKNNGN